MMVDHFALNVKVFKLTANIQFNQKMSWGSELVTLVPLSLIIIQLVGYVVYFFQTAIHDFEMLAVNMRMLLVYLYMAFRYVTLIVKRRDFEILFDKMNATINVHQIFCSEGTFRPSILTKIAERADLITACHLVMALGATLLWAVVPVLTKSGQLPFSGSWYPFDVDEYYFFLYIFQVLVTCQGVLVGDHVDPLYIKLCAILCQQFDILEHSLRRLFEEEKQDREMWDWKFKKCLNFHSAIIGCCHQVEQCVTGILLVQFVFTTIILCFAAFATASMKTYDGTFINLLLYLLLACLELFVYCWLGNELTEHGKKISQAVFDGDWIKCDIKLKKALRLVMMQSDRPIVLRGGTVFNMSMYNFFRVIRESISYFMVLRQLSAKDLV